MRYLCLFMCLCLPWPLFLGGCARTSTHVSRDVVYYPKCEEPLVYLASRGNASGAVAKGAATGAFISGITTLIAGAISGRLDPLGLAGGVGAGAVVGGTLGGVDHSADSKADTRQMSLYLEEIDGDISDIDTVEKAGATLARQCYGNAFNKLLGQMKTREIQRDAALARFDEILAGMREADGYLGAETNFEPMKKEFADAEK